MAAADMAASASRTDNPRDDQGQTLPSVTRRAGVRRSQATIFATYAIGLLSDGERKSMEPIAARACADPGRINAEHQRLAHFLSNSNWRDKDVRREAAAYALEVLTERETVVAPLRSLATLSKARSPGVPARKSRTAEVR